jgi:hypothetical protein
MYTPALIGSPAPTGRRLAYSANKTVLRYRARLIANTKELRLGYARAEADARAASAGSTVSGPPFG